jgi:hypothetical protein
MFSKTIAVLIMVFIALNIADLVLTHYAVAQGFKEKNPLLKKFVESGNFLIPAVIKALTIVLICCLLALIPYEKIRVSTMAGLVMFYLGVVVYHADLLRWYK